MSNLEEALEQLARAKAVLFCYGCYSQAPTGRCNTCGSDDLMFELPGCGVEYGLSWIICEVLRENLEPADTQTTFEESVGD